MTRPPALLAASAALAALALAGCSDSGSTSSPTTGGVTPTTAPSTPDIGASASSLASGAASGASSAASGASSAAASAGDQLAAIRDCLQKANLPTPTSTDVTGLATELPGLISNPQVRDALKQCNVSVPGL